MHDFVWNDTTTLESILAKIAEADEPAASRRVAAACLAEKLSFPFMNLSTLTGGEIHSAGASNAHRFCHATKELGLYTTRYEIGELRI